MKTYHERVFPSLKENESNFDSPCVFSPVMSGPKFSGNVTDFLSPFLSSMIDLDSKVSGLLKQLVLCKDKISLKPYHQKSEIWNLVLMNHE